MLVCWSGGVAQCTQYRLLLCCRRKVFCDSWACAGTKQNLERSAVWKRATAGDFCGHEIQRGAYAISGLVFAVKYGCCTGRRPGAAVVAVDLCCDLCCPLRETLPRASNVDNDFGTRAVLTVHALRDDFRERTGHGNLNAKHACNRRTAWHDLSPDQRLVFRLRGPTQTLDRKTCNVFRHFYTVVWPWTTLSPRQAYFR